MRPVTKASACGITRRQCLRMGAMAGVVSASRASWAAAPQETDGTKDVVLRQVRWTFELVNPLAEALQDQKMWFYAPAAQAPRQTLSSLQVSMPCTRTTDALGHEIVQLGFPQVAPLARRAVSVVADLAMYWEPRPSVLPDGEAWLHAERYIEVLDPAVQATARQLRRGEPRETGRAIYDWVRQNLQYAGYIADDLGAADAISRRRGDCTEYAYVTVALARANGLPARMVGGHEVDRNTTLRAETYHNWAELYFDGRWNLVDPQKERWLELGERYVAFRIYRDAAINPIGLAHRYAIQGQLKAFF